MRIEITGRNIDVTPALKNIIEKKSEKIKYFFPHILDVHVYLIVNKNTHKAEITLNSEGKSFFCDATSDDMYNSIDLMYDKIERQIRKYKEKLMNHKSVTSTAKNFLQKRKSEEDNVRITKIKEILPKPMSGHEAILQLSLNSHKFELFKEDRDRNYAAVALKNNGNTYCIIDQRNGSWEMKQYKLLEKDIELLSQENTDIFQSTQIDAIDTLLEKDLDYLIFQDTENNNLNILYVRKNNTLGLITSE